MHSSTVIYQVTASRFPCCVFLALSWNTNENSSTDKLNRATRSLPNIFWNSFIVFPYFSFVSCYFPQVRIFNCRESIWIIFFLYPQSACFFFSHCFELCSDECKGRRLSLQESTYTELAVFLFLFIFVFVFLQKLTMIMKYIEQSVIYYTELAGSQYPIYTVCYMYISTNANISIYISTPYSVYTATDNDI